MKVAILGTGAYGLALALMVHENKCDIMMWTKFEDEKEMLECYRENKRVLPGVKIPDNIKTNSSAYLYPHNYKNHYVKQNYMPKEYIGSKYYIPQENNIENGLNKVYNERTGKK